MIDYSPDFKNNHMTRFLAEEYEKLSYELTESKEAAGGDSLMLEMLAEDETRIEIRQKEILEDI